MRVETEIIMICNGFIKSTDKSRRPFPEGSFIFFFLNTYFKKLNIIINNGLLAFWLRARGSIAERL